jgi:hypothetical protein
MDSNTFNSELLWLNVTNIGLGLVVAVCMVMIAGAIVVELRARHRKRVANMSEIDRDLATGQVFAADAHTLFTPELGLTMADGGEPVEPPKPALKPRARKR